MLPEDPSGRVIPLRFGMMPVLMRLMVHDVGNVPTVSAATVGSVDPNVPELNTFRINPFMGVPYNAVYMFKIFPFKIVPVLFIILVYVNVVPKNSENIMG